MSSKVDNERQKFIHDKCQIILGNLLREEDNKYCVDCDAKGPRWASWNLGIFLCIRCAGIHRNLGVHISKVKSVNLDTWTPEQVGCLQQMGNSQARAVYEANLPESFRRPQTDSSLEAFIRAKYEQKKYIAKEWVPPPAAKPAFDIEEEKRKEKEKKRKSKAAAGLEIPALSQLPTALPRRPNSTGPASPSVKSLNSEPLKPPAPQVPDSADLLSLGESNPVGGDDIFDTFLSAPTSGSENFVQQANKVSTRTDDSQNVSTDEADFFNQKSEGDGLQTNKLTKESILSLYGSNACQVPASQSVPPVYGVSGGVYISQPAYAQVAVGGFPSVSNPGMTVPGPSMTAMYNPFGSLSSSQVRPELIQQPNAWIGGIDPIQIAQGIGQVSQQISNIQLSGTTWNAGVNPITNSGGLVIGANQTSNGIMWPNSACSQNQNISNNFWK